MTSKKVGEYSQKLKEIHDEEVETLSMYVKECLQELGFTPAAGSTEKFCDEILS